MRCSGCCSARSPPANCATRSTRWNHGYCPACGSWPAVGEVAAGHRTLRCSFCSCAWELNTYACIYCENSGEGFVTAAPDEQRKDRRIEVCSALRRLPQDDRSPRALAVPAAVDLGHRDHGPRRGSDGTRLREARAQGLHEEEEVRHQPEKTAEKRCALRSLRSPRFLLGRCYAATRAARRASVTWLRWSIWCSASDQEAAPVGRKLPFALPSAAPPSACRDPRR